MTATVTEATDLDMLAYDLSKTLDRCGYDEIDASADEIREALPAFLANLREIAERRAEEEPGADAASWSPTIDEPEEPAVQTGPRPRATYLGWWKSQTVMMGATAVDAHYWQCPKTGCKVWAGPYTDVMHGKQIGMDHVYREHDLPAARATERRRAERKAARA
jgi:hypothetical protein